MEETIRKKIDNRVFSKKDIIRIAELLESQNKDEELPFSGSKYKINCFDTTTYESGSITILTNENIVDIKRARSIEMSYESDSLNRSIKIELFHNGPTYENLIIKGDDRNWVKGTLANVEEMLNSTPPQDNFVIRHPKFLSNVVALGVGIIISYAIYFLLEFFETPQEAEESSWFTTYSISNFLIRWSIFWIVGWMTYAEKITKKVLELWPSTEFDFGPEHLKIEKNRRKVLIGFITLIVVPILMSVIFEFIKAVYK